MAVVQIKVGHRQLHVTNLKSYLRSTEGAATSGAVVLKPMIELSWIRFPVRTIPDVIERTTLSDSVVSTGGSGFLLH
jgi:hypothetical protein